MHPSRGSRAIQHGAYSLQYWVKLDGLQKGEISLDHWSLYPSAGVLILTWIFCLVWHTWLERCESLSKSRTNEKEWSTTDLSWTKKKKTHKKKTGPRILHVNDGYSIRGVRVMSNNSAWSKWISREEEEIKQTRCLEKREGNPFIKLNFRD